jgi:hypothetical protein
MRLLFSASEGVSESGTAPRCLFLHLLLRLAVDVGSGEQEIRTAIGLDSTTSRERQVMQRASGRRRRMAHDRHFHLASMEVGLCPMKIARRAKVDAHARLTPDDRRRIAAEAAPARWDGDLPSVEFSGMLELGDLKIPARC